MASSIGGDRLLMYIVVSLLVVIPVCIAADTVNRNGFDGLDLNHDGGIDLDEYTQGVERFQSALRSGFVNTPNDKNVASSLDYRLQQQQADSDMGLSFWPAFVNSLSMIIATEIGDKTFFIAAVMSMRNDRLAVFAGAILALICMTILSSLMGLVLPAVIPRQYTHIFGGILFLYFGVKLIVDARSIPQGKCSDELEEVEEELLSSGAAHKKKQEEETEESLEEGTSAPSSSSSREKIFIQALTLTFLAEWGDRSQIATIALAAAKDPYGVNAGAILGHSLCTGMAVLGGRMLAARIEERTVTMFSGVIFLCFGVHALFVENVE